MYCEPLRPLRPPADPEQALPDRPYGDLLDSGDVLGKRIVRPRVHRAITVREENAIAALESEPVDPRL